MLLLNTEHFKIYFAKDCVKQVIDCKGGTVCGREIKLEVPENALHKFESVAIEMQACLGGPFDIPDDVTLVSPVFKITPHFTFLREVSLTITHFANLESAKDCEELVLLTSPAECDPETKRWVFTKCPTRPECSPGSREATVHLSHFSLWALARKIFKGTLAFLCLNYVQIINYIIVNADVLDKLGHYWYCASLYSPKCLSSMTSPCHAVFIITVDSCTYKEVSYIVCVLKLVLGCTLIIGY